MLLLYLVWMIGLNGMNGLDIHQISDGIIITKGHNLSVIEGEWTLLLTIHEGDVTNGLQAHAELVKKAKEIWNVVERQNVSLFLTEDRKALMKAKVNLVLGANPVLSYDIIPTRERRGVLDFIGTGLNWAFGTATQGQIDALQNAVDLARTSQQAVVHNVNEMITVINQTQREGLDTRQKLSTLSTSYNRFVRAENNRWNRFDHNTRLLMIEEYVNTLLWLDTAVWKRIDKIQMMHSSLRAGHLTEELCPVRLLKEISRLAATHGLVSLTANWYYENVMIEPLMIRDGLMTFQVVLPYTDNRVYKRYHIQTFAVPLDNTGARARVNIATDIAMDTTDGFWFIPTMCQGRRPQLCRAGPRWKDAFPCERGLITGHGPDRKNCILESTTTNVTTAQELLEGVFVIQTLGESIRLACTGQPQEQTILSRGVYQLQLDEGCTLSGGRWALHGIIRRYLSVRTEIQPLDVPRLDIMAIMRARPVINDTSPEIELNFDNINNKYVPRYMDMHDDDGYPEIMIAHHLSWTAIGFIVLLCILGIIGGVWLYRRRQKIRFFFADALLTKVKAKQVEKAIRYSAKAPELVETVESATAGEIETV